MTRSRERNGLSGFLRRIPTAAWLCGLVALMLGFAWSLVVPAFQTVDEPQNVAYAQYLAESGRPPTGSEGIRGRSDEQRLLMRALRYKQFQRDSNLTPAFERRLRRAVDTSSSRRGEGGYTYAANQPPLYYALVALAYRASPSNSLLDRIQAMRVVSVLLGATTVLLVFLFLRELLPGAPWAWTVGALAVAFQPVFNNVSGGVNGDSLFYAAAAGVFLGLAASFRRGLTPGRGIAIGACMVAGVLGKITMLGLLPGVAIGLILLVHAADRESRPEAIRGALAAIAAVALPVLVYMSLNSTVWERGLFLAADGGDADDGTAGATTLGGLLSHIWQFYLPRLPSMSPAFDDYPLAHIWYEGFVGRFGGGEYAFSPLVRLIALPVYVTVLILAARELISSWEAVRRRLRELATYAAIVLGVLLLIHVAGYIGRFDLGRDYEQARYLLPLLALYGAIVALAARGAGSRYGRSVGVLLVSLAIAHSLLGLLLSLTRYYG